MGLRLSNETGFGRLLLCDDFSPERLLRFNGVSGSNGEEMARTHEYAEQQPHQKSPPERAPYSFGFSAHSD